MCKGLTFFRNFVKSFSIIKTINKKEGLLSATVCTGAIAN